MTNFKLVTQQLLDELIAYLADADTIYLLVSFVMDSGVQLLALHLKAAATRGADIKILTGDYLYVTQPQGIASLVSIHPQIEARLWRSHGVSFHPKAYLMQRQSGENVLIVGSEVDYVSSHGDKP